MADSPGSTILQEEIDEDYEPTEEEILEFASWLGMELPQEQSLLWIARRGLKAPLPAEWKPCRTEEDEIYYFNFDTGESSWDHPCDEFYRNVYREEVQHKRQQLQQRPLLPSSERKDSTGVESSYLETPRDKMTPSGNPRSSNPQNRLSQYSAPDEELQESAQHNNAQPARAPGMMIKWKSAIRSDEQDNSTRQLRAGGKEEQWKAQADNSREANTTPQQETIPAEQVLAYKSMQAELLEKIKKDLELEGGTLLEQRRKEVLEEVERQIEVERKRLQDIQTKKLEQDLELEQKMLEKKEEERKHAWENKLLREKEENLKMSEDLESRRRRRDEDLVKVMELEKKKFEAESKQRLQDFRNALADEEKKMIDKEKEKKLQKVRSKIQLEESLVLKEAKQEALARMKQVIGTLERKVYDREVEQAKERVTDRAAWSKKQAQMRMEREVEAEMASLKDDMLSQRWSEALDQVSEKVMEEHKGETALKMKRMGGAPPSSRGSCMERESCLERSPPASECGTIRSNNMGSNRILGNQEQMMGVLQKAAIEVLLNLVHKNSKETTKSCNCEEQYGMIKRSVIELEQEVSGLREQSKGGGHSDLER